VSAAPSLRGPPESVPIVHETSERVVRTLVFALPPAALLAAGWMAWGGTLHWHDLLVLAITYTLSSLGITVGFHRLFTHRSFKTTRAVRALLAVFGSMAVEGPLIEWVSTHNHHAFPTSARHGLGRRELDPGAWLISALERCHLAWDVVRISPDINRPSVDLR
jgi:stearoyl-CoA desaturase (delta-9 desaturase)